MVRLLLILILISAALIECGCSSRGQIEVLESGLRSREDEISRLSNELKKSRNQVRDYREELAALQKNTNDLPLAYKYPEQAKALLQVKSIKIDPINTGIIPASAGIPQQLNVVVTPIDDQNEVIRVPGTCEIEIWDITGFPKKTILKKEYNIHETAESWLRNFLVIGHQFQFPLLISQDREIKITSKLITTDGRVFEASHRLDFDTGALEQVGFDNVTVEGEIIGYEKLGDGNITGQKATQKPWQFQGSGSSNGSNQPEKPGVIKVPPPKEPLDWSQQLPPVSNQSQKFPTGGQHSPNQHNPGNSKDKQNPELESSVNWYKDQSPTYR